MGHHLNPSDARAYTRREFLRSSTMLASAAMTAPSFIQHSALALTQPAPGMSSVPGVDEDRILVVVQLSGGNDGLNTLVPFNDDAYHRVRPRIGLGQRDVIPLGRGADLGLHRAMGGVKSLYDEGRCAVIQGVGYPNPNRSHFASMDIWHTADTTGTGDGWIGRYMDARCCGYGKGESGKPDGSLPTTTPPVSIGREAPLALHGREMMPLSIENPDLYTWSGEGVSDEIARAYRERIAALDDANAGGGRTDNHAFLVRTALDARVSSERIREAVEAETLVAYPGSSLGRQLSMVGSMIRAGLKTRVYYTSMGSFDTHANQGGAGGTHARLLGRMSDAVRAFYDDLAAQGNDGRVLTMCFSEFGRRVGQNASGGTDHGTAAPMFLFGPMVRPGLHARTPSLTDLDAGDLKHTADFRQVYAEILDEWLGAASERILGDRHRHLRVIDA